MHRTLALLVCTAATALSLAGTASAAIPDIRPPLERCPSGHGNLVQNEFRLNAPAPLGCLDGIEPLPSP